MSGRRTTEIKIRVTPDEKASWQADADKDDVSLSALIRSTMNWRAQNTRLDSTSLVGNAIALLEPEVDIDFRGNDAFSPQLETPVIPNRDEEHPVAPLAPCRGEGMQDAPLCPPCVEAGGCKLPAAPEVPIVWENVDRHPWTFEARNG